MDLKDLKGALRRNKPKCWLKGSTGEVSFGMVSNANHFTVQIISFFLFFFSGSFIFRMTFESSVWEVGFGWFKHRSGRIFQTGYDQFNVRKLYSGSAFRLSNHCSALKSHSSDSMDMRKGLQDEFFLRAEPTDRRTKGRIRMKKLDDIHGLKQEPGQKV